jgi:hypothetical protein
MDSGGGGEWLQSSMELAVGDGRVGLEQCSVEGGGKVGRNRELEMWRLGWGFSKNE